MIRREPQKALDGLDKVSSLQVVRSPVPLQIEGSAADILDGSRRASRVLLFKRSAKTIDAGVAPHVGRAGAVGEGLPIGEDQHARSGKLDQSMCTMVFMEDVDLRLPPFLRREVIGKVHLEKSRNVSK